MRVRVTIEADVNRDTFLSLHGDITDEEIIEKLKENFNASFNDQEANIKLTIESI